jgi:sugar-specific transcriptional regulator TrmB
MNIPLVPQEDAVQILNRLGLTCNQAKVYLALVRSGVSTAKTISKNSNVAREDIYRIIPTLQELGLVEKIIDTTSMYTAIPMQEAFKILMKSRKQATSELEAKTKEIMQNFNSNGIRTTPEEEMHEFILFPKERAIIKRKKMIDNAQKSIDFIILWERLTHLKVSYATNLTNALKKRVEIRIIVGNPESEKSLLSLIQNWREKYPCFRARWIPSNPDACLMLVDNQKVLFAKSTTTNFEESTFLWSINRSLLSVVKDYFEMMWLTSFETKNEEHAIKTH